MKKILVIFLAIATAAFAASFTTAWNETSPADGDAAKLGASKIREFKIQVRQRMAADHIWDASDSTTTETIGLHNKVSLLSQASDPDTGLARGLLYTKTTDGEVYLYFRGIHSDARRIDIPAASTVDDTAIVSMSASKLTGTIIPSDSTVTDTKIVGVDGSKITDGTVTDTKISGVDGSKITDGTITAAKLAAGVGNYSLVLSADVTADTDYEFTGLETGCNYELVINVMWNTTDGHPRLIFNGDTAQHYQWSNMASGQGSLGGGGSSTATSMPICYNNDGWKVNATDLFYSTVRFAIVPSDTKSVMMTFLSLYKTDNSGGLYMNVTGGGHFTGSTSVTSVSLTTSAGTYTGNLSLYKISR